jgi:hypothetical protein
MGLPWRLPERLLAGRELGPAKGEHDAASAAVKSRRVIWSIHDQILSFAAPPQHRADDAIVGPAAAEIAGSAVRTSAWSAADCLSGSAPQ